MPIEKRIAGNDDKGGEGAIIGGTGDQGRNATVVGDKQRTWGVNAALEGKGASAKVKDVDLKKGTSAERVGTTLIRMKLFQYLPRFLLTWVGHSPSHEESQEQRVKHVSNPSAAQEATLFYLSTK